MNYRRGGQWGSTRIFDGQNMPKMAFSLRPERPSCDTLWNSEARTTSDARDSSDARTALVVLVELRKSKVFFSRNLLISISLSRYVKSISLSRDVKSISLSKDVKRGGWWFLCQPTDWVSCNTITQLDGLTTEPDDDGDDQEKSYE